MSFYGMSESCYTYFGKKNKNILIDITVGWYYYDIVNWKIGVWLIWSLSDTSRHHVISQNPRSIFISLSVENIWKTVIGLT
jgi:hypothetical protein